MRFMVMVKADRNSEAGVLPSRGLLEAMGKYNEELAKAGVLLSGEGLHASSEGARVKFSGKNRSVIAGPFPEANLLAGFWIFQVKSKEEAIEWVKRCPNPMEGEPEIETRRFDTRFFLARLPEGQVPVHDRMELTESRWLTPAFALTENAAGRIVLMPPTLKTIEELLTFSNTGQLFLLPAH